MNIAIKIKRLFFYCCIVISCISIHLSAFTSTGFAETQKLTVLASTFPIYQITRNVTHGRDGIDVKLLIPSQLGCPHNYALTPQDMQKLEQADIFAINGLGMEEFLGSPVEKANPKLKIIDSSTGIKGLLQFTTQPEHAHHHDEHEKHHDADKDVHHHGKHGHTGINPHLFASPRMTAQIALNIANSLSKADPSAEELYRSNARVYSEKMNKLADEFVAAGKRLQNNRIVTQHGVFDYLAKDMGLEVTGVVQAHEGQEPSAAELLTLIKNIKNKKAGAIFTEPQYPDKIALAIAKETGIAIAKLDPVATGDEGAPLEYYEIVMRNNLATLIKTLGTK